MRNFKQYFQDAILEFPADVRSILHVMQQLSRKNPDFETSIRDALLTNSNPRFTIPEDSFDLESRKLISDFAANPIRHLILNDAFITNTQCPDNLLSLNNTLEFLYFHCKPSWTKKKGSTSTAEIQKIFEGMHLNQTLTCLDLSFDVINIWNTLIDSLKDNFTIHELGIEYKSSMNQLSFDFMGENTSIRKLKVVFPDTNGMSWPSPINHVSYESVENLFVALRTNSSVEILSVKFGNFEHYAHNQLFCRSGETSKLFEQNRSIREFEIENYHSTFEYYLIQGLAGSTTLETYRTNASAIKFLRMKEILEINTCIRTVSISHPYSSDPRDAFSLIENGAPLFKLELRCQISNYIRYEQRLTPIDDLANFSNIIPNMKQLRELSIFVSFDTNDDIICLLIALSKLEFLETLNLTYKSFLKNDVAPCLVIKMLPCLQRLTLNPITKSGAKYETLSHPPLFHQVISTLCENQKLEIFNSTTEWNMDLPSQDMIRNLVDRNTTLRECSIIKGYDDFQDLANMLARNSTKSGNKFDRI